MLYIMKYIILIVIIVIVALYMYNVNACQCSIENNNADVAIRHRNENFTENKGKGKGKTLILYWATWCHHCETFMSTWNDLKIKYNGQIEFKDVEHTQMSEDQIRKAGGFPTIYYVDENGNETRIKQRYNIPNEIGLQ